MNHLDINIYFRDKFGRCCVLASGGGNLPEFLMKEESFEQNIKIDYDIHKLPSAYHIRQNPFLEPILTPQYQRVEKDQESTSFEDSNSLNEVNFLDIYKKNFNGPSTKVNLNFNENKYQDFEDYFFGFNFLASKGLYVYDKLNIHLGNDDHYILVSYPVYTKRDDNYEMLLSKLQKIPVIKESLIVRKNGDFFSSSFKQKNLIYLLDRDSN